MLRNVSKYLMGGLLVAVSCTALADDNVEMRDYMALDYQHIFRDNARVSDNGHGASIGYGMALDKIWGLEFNGFYDQFGENQGRPTDWREYGAKVSGLFFYSRDPAFSPYFGLGVGVIHSDERVSNTGSTDPMVDVGLGFFRYFNIGSFDFAMRAEARYRWMDTNGIAPIGDLGEPVLKVGFVLPFGGRDTPAALPVAAKKPMLDPVPADEPANVRAFIPVHFAFNKSDLNQRSRDVLDKAVGDITEMLKEESLTVELDGHTDSVGTDAYNQKLSDRRAKAVAAYLESKGISKDIITTRAYGKTKPVEDNKSESGRAFNRRVVIRVIE